MEHFKDFSKEVIDRLARIETKLDANAKRIERQENLINGNGNVGIKTKVSIMWWGLGLTFPLSGLIIAIYKLAIM